MNGKKRYLAIILFLLIGLTIFAFANPDEEKELEGKDNGTSEKVENKDDKEEQKEDEDSELVNSDTDDKESIENSNKENNKDKVDNTNENARKAVERAEASLSSTDLVVARTLVALVTDAELKEEFTKRLDAVEDAIDATLLVETLENMTYNATDKDGLTAAISYREDKQVQAAISTLTIEDVKADLQARLDAVNKILNDTTAPLVSGVEDGETTNQDVTITVTDDNEVTVKVTLDGQEIENSATFTEEGEYVYSVTDAAFNETVVTFTIDKTAPEFVGISSGSHYASITLDAKDATEVKFTVENKDNGETTELAVGDTLTLDATYYITAIDAAGNTKSVWVAIDTTAPVISGVDETKPTNRNEIVYVKDKFLMTVTIDGVEYTREDFEVEGNNENFSFQKKITHAGTHTVTATDKVGNTTTVTFVIDKTAPEAVSVEKSNNDKSTNQDVTVTLTVNEAIVTPEGWTKVSDTVFTKVYLESGKYSVEITDIAGNTNTVKFEVKRIDKVAPDATVTTSNEGNPTNEDVTVTLTSNEAIYKPEGWTEVNTNKEHEFTKVYSENGDYSVEIIDKAGNKKVINFTVSGIDREAPGATVTTSNEGNPTNEDVTVTLTATETITTPTGWTKVSDTVFTKDYEENGNYSVEITDIAGNNAIIDFSVSGIDREAPEATSLRIIGGNYYNENGKHVRYATNGTTVYVYTTFAEELAVAPTVTLNGTVTAKSYLAKADEGSYIYAAKFVINENDGLANGELKFEVTGYADAAGNVGRVLTNEDITLDSQKYVIIDKTPVTFTLSEGTIGTNPYSKINLKLYDANGVASVEINGTKLPHTGKYVDINDGDAYTFVEGENVVTVTDKAGNKTTMTYVKDVTAPERSSLRIIGGNYYNESGKHVRYATNGTTVYVYTTFAEELAVAPTVTLNGTVTAKSYLAKADEGSYIYAAKFVINENDGLANGEILIGVSGYADAAGNVGRVLTNEDITLDSQKYVIIDKTPVTFTLSEGTIGTNPYSKINLKLYDANGVASVEINGTKLPHTGKYVDINDGDAYTFVEGENVVTVTDKAGNKTTMTYVKDVTAPTIELAGTEGRNNNEYRVEAGTEVSVSDVMATATDNYDNDVEVVITKADFLATKEHPERNVYGYDFSNGFDTTTVGRYNITYKATDAAGNSSTKTMLLVISDTTAPTIILKGTEGRNNNELRVNQKDVVTLDDVTAISKDIVDGEEEIYPVSITRFYPAETGKPSHSYDASNGFDTSIPGRYNITYEVTDEAGNTTTATMLLVIKPYNDIKYSEEVVLDEDTTLSDVVTVKEGTKKVIDLNGKTLNLETEEKGRLFTNKGELVFKNGKIVQKSKEGKGIVDNKGVVKFDNVDVIDYGSYDNSTINNNGGEVIITNSTFEVSATKGVFTESTTCASRACANAIVDNNNNGNLTIKDTKLSGNSEYAYAVLSSSGNVNIDNVVINNKRGGLGINGGIITISNTDIDVPSGANSYHGIYIYNTSNTKLTFNSGSVIANRYAMYIANGSDTGTVDVTINGGTFNTRQPKKYKSITVDSASNLVVNGGTFKNANVTSYLAEGLIQLSDGTVVHAD